MKKTIIISAIALCFSIVSVNATSFSKTVNTNIEDYYSVKVNSFCVSIAKGDVETVKKLLARGENVNEKSNGMTPVMYAAKYNRTEILKLLISKGADLKAKSDKGFTAAKYAQLHGAHEAKVIIKEALDAKKKK
ncbi:ankyrin repeat domain-containing protein [Thalassobellus suaedae]|uniref:Ankyrin repeat domain-containing protein n=1 Tax=Thalassobellus suaedae TaxID=3074124 RepID=A0ABY9Y4Z8_9FLAO|nr:ankyrin repeat domain-containing protein [Flavobacteriaceae bacterium HL-DH10]